jgi:hypothetical protein
MSSQTYVLKTNGSHRIDILPTRRCYTNTTFHCQTVQGHKRLTVASFSTQSQGFNNLAFKTHYMQINSEEDLLNQERIAASLSVQEKIARIRDFNQRLGLPIENPNNVLYNGALFDATHLNHNLFLVVHPNFEHPLSAYPQEVQIARITQYAFQLAEQNTPRACFIGINKEPGNLWVTIHTKEVNRHRYWTFVQRTVFLHREEPITSIDIISPSNTLAPPDYPASPDYNNTFRAPADIDYECYADLC